MLHHDIDTFIKIDLKKSKEPRKQRQYPSVGKVLHKLELPTHILHSRGFSAVQLTKPWEKKTFLRQDHLIIVIKADKKSPKTKRCTAYKHWPEKRKDCQRQNQLLPFYIVLLDPAWKKKII